MYKNNVYLISEVKFNQNKFIMKKVNLLILSLAAVAGGFLSSCNKDSAKPGPSISAYLNGTQQDAVSVSKGSSVAYKFEVSAPAKLKSITLTTKVGANSTTGTPKTSGFVNDTIDIIQANIAVTDNIELTLAVVDKNDVQTTKTLTITAKVGAVSMYSAKLLGAQSNSAGSSLATSTGTIYTSADAATNSALVDLIYYFNSGTEASSIYSPSALAATGSGAMSYGWATKNATTFGIVSMSTADFDAITATDDTPITAKAVSLTATKLFTLAVDNIFAFQTAAGKSGLAKVKSIATGASGSITIDVKVQK